MTTNLGRPWRPLGFLVLVAVLSPGCGGGTTPSNPPLFQDFFNGTVLSAAWSAPVATGSATATIDQTVGDPLPSLKMTTTAATSDSVSTSPTMTFSNPLVTFSIAMADLSTATSQLGTGTITILNGGSIASASWSNATGQITFHINGGTDATSAVIPADGTFHEIVFSVNSAGVGSWSLDNAAAVVQQPVAAGSLTLQLGATFGTGTAWPAFYFDNVTVTSP
jgi:hypothetical protein